MSKLLELADKYADAMERGPFSRSYRGNIQDARAALEAEVNLVEADNKRMREALSRMTRFQDIGQAEIDAARAAIGETK